MPQNASVPPSLAVDLYNWDCGRKGRDGICRIGDYTGLF